MIRSLLWRLHQNAEASFDEAELQLVGSNVLSGLHAARVLQPTPIDGNQLTHITKDGRLLEAIDDGESWELIDPDDVDFEPIPIDVRSLRRWRVDLHRLAHLLQKVNGLKGECGIVSPRLMQLGRADKETVIVALFPTWTQAREPLFALQSKILGSLIVGTMGTPPTVLESLELRSLGVYVVGMTDEGRVDIGGLVASTVIPRRRKGRLVGRGVGSLLDCWIECHQLHVPFHPIQQFYAAAHDYLLQHPAEVASVPSRERFAYLRYNGQQARRKAGRCVWHRCSSPPDPSHLVSH